MQGRDGIYDALDCLHLILHLITYDNMLFVWWYDDGGDIIYFLNLLNPSHDWKVRQELGQSDRSITETDKVIDNR